MLVNLASGKKKEYPRIRRFAFNGDTATHVALHRALATPPPAPVVRLRPRPPPRQAEPKAALRTARAVKRTVQIFVSAVWVFGWSGVAQAQPVTSVQAGIYHTCALIAGGGVTCWGYKSGAWAGMSPADSKLPLDVLGLTSGAAQLSPGWAHNCVRTSSDGAKCWGSNSWGQLGNSSSGALVDVFGLTSGVESVTGGGAHSCATVTGGGARCWGLNFSGRLGDGTGLSSTAPVEVAGLGSGVTLIEGHLADGTCAISGGGLRCWGRNHLGQLGNGGNSNSTVPVDVSGLSTGVASVALVCWGNNASGQLGNNSFVDKETPVNVSGLSSGVIGLTAGGNHTCALLLTGRARCCSGR